jgi:hypothetical protein
MTVNNSRSSRASLLEGATDGKYRKVRPDTTVVDTAGNAKIEADRDGLNPFMNYGYITSEATRKINPGR